VSLERACDLPTICMVHMWSYLIVREIEAVEGGFLGSSSQVRFHICYSPHRARSRMNSYVLQIERVCTAAANSNRHRPWFLLLVQICRINKWKNQNTCGNNSNPKTQRQHSPSIPLATTSLCGVSLLIPSRLSLFSSLRTSRQLNTSRNSSLPSDPKSDLLAYISQASSSIEFNSLPQTTAATYY
jgi:hypothetical protein